MNKEQATKTAQEIANKTNRSVFVDWNLENGYFIGNLKDAKKLEWPLIITPEK